ncbi:beta-1,3-N-acetylglucosaminyltransferase lunatic fringe-like [Styela clava]
MLSIPKQNVRSKISVLGVVQMISALTILNLLFTILSFFNVTDVEENYDMDQPMEFGRYRDEKLSIDVIPGAPLIILKPEEVFTRVSRKNHHDNHKFETIKNGIFMSVRTTNKYHKSRLKILLDTWISEVPENTWIITDEEDGWLVQYIRDHFKNAKPHILNTHCPTTSEHKWALLCKLHWEYRTFLSSNKSWFCHFDDDSFVNIGMLTNLLSSHSEDDVVYIGRTPSKTPITAMAYDTENVEPESFGFNETTNETTWVMPQSTFQRVAFHYALGGAGFCISRQLAVDMKEYALGSRLMHMAASINLPDDCVFGYIITHQLNVSLITTNLVHTHMENLTLIPKSSLQQQVTLSYSLPEETRHSEMENIRDTKKNVVENAENSVFFHRNLSDSNVIKPNLTKPNVVNLNKYFPAKYDPTRFYNLHQLVYIRGVQHVDRV